MDKVIKDQHRKILDKLNSASSIIANAVWLAVNTDSDVAGQIKFAIDLGQSMLDDAKEMNSKAS